ncbi:MAG: ImmA/IrrE family metallo-endopeptidase [Spirochaetota bacterium]
MSNRIENINLEILIHCRKQIGLDMAEVKKKVPKILSIELGEVKPTFKQADILAELYKVPRWVFISKSLPEKFQLQKTTPSFRKFIADESKVFQDPKIRSVIARIERHRELVIELAEDIAEPIIPLTPPKWNKQDTPKTIAKKIRNWLQVKEESLDFSAWRKLLERQGIFVFTTSKFKDWSFLDKELVRGFAIYHTVLPIILINDSDPKKAQSFTLFHELAHLLRKETVIDSWDTDKAIEKWCDEVAANVLMPQETFLQEVDGIDSLKDIKNLAKRFCVSTYACLVRARQLKIISQQKYLSLQKQMQEEYEKAQKKLKESEGGPPRNRSKEIVQQYGTISTNILFQAYQNSELSLHKLMKHFGIKKAPVIFQIEQLL